MAVALLPGEHMRLKWGGGGGGNFSGFPSISISGSIRNVQRI